MILLKLLWVDRDEVAGYFTIDANAHVYGNLSQMAKGVLGKTATSSIGGTLFFRRVIDQE